MNRSKRRLTTITYVVALLLLFSGCAIFTEGKKKLNQYCPGLNIDLSYVAWIKMDFKNVCALYYDEVYEQKAETYFINASKYYVQGQPGDFSDISIHSEPLIHESDKIVIKTIQKDKGSTEVIFDDARRCIIIIEHEYDKK